MDDKDTVDSGLGIALGVMLIFCACVCVFGSVCHQYIQKRKRSKSSEQLSELVYK
jgi:hypothetical protein